MRQSITPVSILMGISVALREDKGVREFISYIGPIPILIPLKLFLVTTSKFQNFLSFEWIDIFHYFFQL